MLILVGCDEYSYAKPIDMHAYFYTNYNLGEEFRMLRVDGDSIDDTLYFKVTSKSLDYEKGHFIGTHTFESFNFGAATGDNKFAFYSYGNEDGAYGNFNGFRFSFIEVILPRYELNGMKFQSVFVHKTETGPTFILYSNAEHGIIQVKTDSLTLTKIIE